MGVALKVENVSIRYITGDFKDIGVKEYVVRNLTHQYHVNEFMAVRDVSFQLEQGDMLGIVGANGAGKSTLLKVIAGIMAPTKGSVTAFGEVAALLELASGFDGDLTVRENAYLRGAMLGYTKDFMDRTYEQIIDFAELHGFEDRPFKQLSSGMKSRLAFSIASLVQPDILILDEVLSVGDGAFQEKSAKKMREIIDQGATTILVSHSLGQIRELCNKVLWLDHGRQVAFGETREICDQYERFLSSGQMPAASETVPAREAAAQTDVPRPKKKRFRAAALLSAVVLGAFAAMVVQAGVSNILQTSGVNEDSILIYSDTLDCPVTYRGATAAGGTWVSPWDNVKASGGWSFDEIQATYTATDGSPLEISLPKGSGRALTFDAGPDQGTARVVVGGETIYIDCYNEATVELGLPHSLPDSAIVGENLPYIVSGIAFILMAGSVIVLNRQKSAPPP